MTPTEATPLWVILSYAKIGLPALLPVFLVMFSAHHIANKVRLFCVLQILTFGLIGIFEAFFTLIGATILKPISVVPLEYVLPVLNLSSIVSLLASAIAAIIITRQTLLPRWQLLISGTQK